MLLIYVYTKTLTLWRIYNKLIAKSSPISSTPDCFPSPTTPFFQEQALFNENNTILSNETKTQSNRYAILGAWITGAMKTYKFLSFLPHSFSGQPNDHPIYHPSAATISLCTHGKLHGKC
jgi:hypothetical protein